MKAENEIQPLLEPESRQEWYPLKEADDNGTGIITVGNVAWFPAQMPNNFEISPTVLEPIVIQMGFDGVVLRHSSPPESKPELSVRSVDKTGTATISKAKTVSAAKPTDHEKTDNLLILDLNFTEIMAQGRETPGFYQLSKKFQQELLGNKIDSAIKHELLTVAKLESFSKAVAELRSFHTVIAWLVFVFFQDQLLHAKNRNDMSPEVKLLSDGLMALSIIIGYLTVRYSEAIINFKQQQKKSGDLNQDTLHALMEAGKNLTKYVHLFPAIDQMLKPLLVGIETRFIMKKEIIRSQSR